MVAGLIFVATSSIVAVLLSALQSSASAGNSAKAPATMPINFPTSKKQFGRLDQSPLGAFPHNFDVGLRMSRGDGVSAFCGQEHHGSS